LSGDIAVSGMASSAEEALVDLKSLRHDVLLLDIKLSNMNGVELISALRAQGNLPPTLILTTFEDDGLLMDGLKAGAKGYLLKDVSLEQLIEAIREIAAGGSHINPAATDRLLRAALKGNGERLNGGHSLSRLTTRETEILRLMANGFSNAEIGRVLGVGEGTIKNHVSSILGKLGVRDRTRAVLKGLQNGLI
jgi:DNA-binding NarL/FixJ family response regulator